MASQEILDLLRTGKETWNDRHLRDWSEYDLSDANLEGMDLSEFHLSGVNFKGAILRHTILDRANLGWCDLTNADMRNAHMFSGDLHHAELIGANLENMEIVGVNLNGANLEGANLKGAAIFSCFLRKTNFTNCDMTNSNIGGSSFIGSILDGTIFDGSKVYGSSVWDTKGTIKSQRDLIVTNDEAAVITVDNIKMAQFLYLLITNEEIKDAVDTLTSRVVLILGRFTPDRKQVLDQMKSSLRGMGLIPVIFDFEGPTSQDFTSTVQLLARISLFVIADLTDPKCIPHELYSIVPDLRTVPVQCIILQGVEPYAMFKDLKVYPWVMPLLHYESSDALLSNFQKDIFDPSKQKAEELRSKI